jgi:hypothetical protein
MKYHYSITSGVRRVKTKLDLGKSLLGFVALALPVALFLSLGGAKADSQVINFENPPYSLGTINGQDGWSKTGSFDADVASNTTAFSSFGSQSLRISNAVTSGSFGDQTFAKPLADSVGETSSTAGSYSVGTKQSHFETQFDIASTMTTEQTGMHTSVSPERGDGSRMSYLRFDDTATGINVFFDDVQGTTDTDPAVAGLQTQFVETQIGTTLNRTVPHTIKLTFDAVDGPSNDVVKVWIDGTLKHTGTSWENYYRYDSEASAEQTPRIVKTVLFRESGAANPANAGKGYLFDNLSLSSGPAPVSTPTAFQVKPWTYDPGKTKKVDSAWKTHEGLVDAGNSKHALYLAKKTTTTTNASGGASVNFSGTLSSLGFDYRNDGWCGAGAPRFNVYTTSGTYYFFGCTYGTHTPSTEDPANWTRVTFSNADAQPAGSTAWPGFGNATVTGIDIVFDEGTDVGPGFAFLDNIQVNGVFAGKPGSSQ